MFIKCDPPTYFFFLPTHLVLLPCSLFPLFNCERGMARLHTPFGHRFGFYAATCCCVPILNLRGRVFFGIIFKTSSNDAPLGLFKKLRYRHILCVTDTTVHILFPDNYTNFGNFLQTCILVIKVVYDNSWQLLSQTLSWSTSRQS